MTNSLRKRGPPAAVQAVYRCQGLSTCVSLQSVSVACANSNDDLAQLHAHALRCLAYLL